MASLSVRATSANTFGATEAAYQHSKQGANVMTTYLTVSGAYGRDYKSAKAAQQDWNEGKDFRVRSLFHRDGTYINKEDADKAGYEVNIRYKNDTMICKANGAPHKMRRLPRVS